MLVGSMTINFLNLFDISKTFYAHIINLMSTQYIFQVSKVQSLFNIYLMELSMK